MLDPEKEEAQLRRLQRIMPGVAGVMALATFVVIYAAGHGFGTSALVSAIMFAFAMSIYFFRKWFGVHGSIAVMGILAFFGWFGQRSGWF
ncbi:MAG: hypothetical protein ACU0DK_09100 [Pseudooceanicola sp.]